MANAGAAVFEAIGRFGGLIGPARTAKQALGGVSDEAERLGGAVPANGGKSAKGLASVATRSGELQRSLNDTGKSLTTKVTGPLALIGGVAVKQFGDFETAIVSAGQKAGASKAELAQMRDIAVKLGAETKFSAGEAATALDNLASAGFDAKGSMDALPGVMLAAQAANEDLGLTADVVARSLNAFGLEAKDSSHVADVLSQAANTTSLNMQDLADGMANAGEVGPRFNQRLEDVVAWMGRLRDMGVPAASAGVAIRQSLASLAKPTTQAGNVIEMLGINVRDAKGEMLPIPQLLENVSKAVASGNPDMKKFAGLAKMNSAQLKTWAKANGVSATQAKQMQTAVKSGDGAFRDYALGTLFGVEGAKAFALAISDGKPVVLDSVKDADKLKQMQDGLAKTMGGKAAKAWIAARTANGKFTASGADTVKALAAMTTASDGTAKKFGEAFSKTTKARLEQLKGSFESLSIVLVDTIAPVLNTIVTGLTDIIGKVADFSKEHKNLARIGLVAVGIAAAFGPVLIILSKIIGAARTVGGVMKKVVPGRGKGGGGPGTAKAGGTGLGSQVYWTKAMPVYIVKGGGTGGSGGGKGGGTTVVPGAGGAGGGKKAPGKTRTFLKAARPTAGRAAGAGAIGGIATLASGGSVGDAAKTAGVYAGIELGVEAAGKAAQKAAPLLARAGAVVGGFGKQVGGFLAATGRVVGGWALMAGRAMANAGRMALAWTIGVLRAAAVAAGQFALTVARVVAGWVLMGVQSLIQAARMAAAWIIAMGPIGWIIVAVIALVALIILKWDTIKKYTIIAWNAILGWLKTAWAWIKTAAQATWNWILGAIKWALNAIWTAITTYVGLWRKVLTGAWNLIKTGAKAAWDGIVGVIRTAWEGLQAIAAKPIRFVIDTVLNGGLIKGFNAISKMVGGPQIPPIKYKFAEGGVMPGYTPGRDVHTFLSPTGGRLDLSGGEAIMRPEWTRAVGGPKAVAAMNASARRGQAFAGGGVWNGISNTAKKVGGAIKKTTTDALDKASSVAQFLKDPGKALDSLVTFATDRLGNNALAQTVGGALKKTVGAVKTKVSGMFGGGGEAVPTGSSKGVMGYQKQVAWLNANAPWAQVTSSFRPGAITASGNRSYHSMGRAIDMTPSMRLFNLIRSAFGTSIKELIYSPANGNQIKNGRPFMYGEPVRSMHFNHVHWAMRRGGTVPGTGRGDKTPILGEPGEFMLTRDIVNRIGIPALTALNAGKATVVPMNPKALLGAAEASRVANVRTMRGVAAGLPTAGALPVNTAAGQRPEWHTTIVNPAPEPASDSLTRSYAKIAYLGLDGKDG